MEVLSVDMEGWKDKLCPLAKYYCKCGSPDEYVIGVHNAFTGFFEEVGPERKEVVLEKGNFDFNMDWVDNLLIEY